MGGMDKDTSKSKYPNNKYSDSLNLRPVTDKGLSTGALENIKGTEELLQMPEINGMAIIESGKITAGGFTLSIYFNSGTPIIISVTVTVDSEGNPTTTMDEVFDLIETELDAVPVSYTKLKDEDRILIYNTNNPVTNITLSYGGSVAPLEVELLPAVSNFVIIGNTPLREKTILFTVNDTGTESLSQIWSMTYDPTDPKGTAAISLIYNGRLNFSKDHPIEALARYENTKTQRVYFTDNSSIPRSFNAVRTDSVALRVKDFALIVENDLFPALVTTEDQDGGTLPAGLWYTTYRLKKFGGASTPIAPFSGATAVTTSQIDLTTNDPKYWDYAYATTIVNTTKILNYSVPTLPEGFDEITVYAVNETAPGQFQAFLVKTETLTSETSYDFTLTTITDLEAIPIEELQQYDVDFERVKTITAKFNRLLFGNVKEASFNLEFDARAYRFLTGTNNSYETDIGALTSKTWEVPESNNSINPVNKDSTALNNFYLYKKNSLVLGGTGPNVSYEFEFKEITLDNSSNAEPSNLDTSSPNGNGNPLWPEKSPYVNMPATGDIDVTVNGNTVNIGSGFTNFKNGRMESYFKGYMRDEVYRFGIVFYSKTGRSSDVKWIGDIRMPSAGDFARDSDNLWEGAIAQWYSKDIPAFQNDATVPKNVGETRGWMLGLKFNVDLNNYVDSTSDIREVISGFSIVRAPRKQKDKTIIAEGALGEVARKKLSTSQSGADYLFPELITKAPFKAVKSAGITLSSTDPASFTASRVLFADGTPTTPEELLACQAEVYDSGNNYNNTGSPSPGYYYTIPEKGDYEFIMRIWNTLLVAITGTAASDPQIDSLYLTLKYEITPKNGGPVRTFEKTLDLNSTLTGDIPSYLNSVGSFSPGDFGLYPQGFNYNQLIPNAEPGDIVTASAVYNVGIVVPPTAIGKTIILKSQITSVGTAGPEFTYFGCAKKVIAPEKNQRLFNLTRVSDGAASLDSVGKPYIISGYNHNVVDDWTLGNSINNTTSIDNTNVGEPVQQYATIDCPDLKFPSGTVVQEYHDDTDAKYVLKPVSGYVHISENTPFNTDSVPTTGGIIFNNNTAVRSWGYSEKGDVYSREASGIPNYIQDRSRYTKALALCNNVSFEERLNFSTGDEYGRIKEFKKIENGGYADVESKESLDPTAEDVKFLNVGYSTNTYDGLQIVNAGSALISKGVFTNFAAGFNTHMTKYLLNYAFGYSDVLDRDKDPYLGEGNTLINGNTTDYFTQHNNYINAGTVGNRIGFYDSNGSGTKTPRRGQVAIVDICRELDKQYGGNTYKQRKDTEYISTGNFSRVTKDTDVSIPITTTVFGGDIFQSAFAEKKLYSTNFNYQAYDSGTGNLGTPQIRFSPIIGRIYPVQSVVNTDMRVGYHFNNYQNYPEDDGTNPIAETYERKRDDYMCPVLYSREKILQSYLVVGQNTLVGEYDNRVYMSQQKLNGELFDSWTIFKPLDYMDVDGHYGPLNKLEVLNDQVLFFQDKSFGILSLNPQSLITDGSGGEVQLGTGRGLVTFRYISNSVGAFHQWGVVKGKGAVYFFDAYHRKFFRYSKGPEPLSDIKGMSSWFFDKIEGSILTSDNPILFKGVTAVYDQRFSEAIFTFHTGVPTETLPDLPGGSAGKLPTATANSQFTLVFNEMTNAFTGFYSHFPRHYISDSRRIFSQPPQGYPVYIHDEGVRGVFYGVASPSIIEIIVNPKGSWTKVFNNIEYLTEASDSTGADLVNVTFDRLKVSNEYQSTGDVTLVVDDNVRRRMRTWRGQIPRDGKARIRNPYMIMKLEYDNTTTEKRLIIHDILTHYLDAPM